jgi:hypothetical protein
MIVSMAERVPGLYQAQIAAPAQPGRYQVTVQATNAQAAGLDELPFSRQRDLLLTVTPDEIHLAGEATPEASDTNGNGLLDRLRFVAPLVIHSSLHGPHGETIAAAQQTVEWSAGAQTLVVEFAGKTIGAAGIDGPYQLHVPIIAAGPIQPLFSATPLAQTPAYGAADFEGRSRLFVYQLVVG